MPKYFSGRVKRTPQGSLTTDRYQYLGLNQAEPNLGDPPELENIPAGQRYQIVSAILRIEDLILLVFLYIILMTSMN